MTNAPTLGARSIFWQPRCGAHVSPSPNTDRVSLDDDLLIRVSGYRMAWRLRRRYLALRFGLSRRRFGISYALDQATTRGRALPDLIKNAAAPVLFAVALVVAMRYLNPLATSAAKGLSWPAPNSNAYDVLLEAVAGVTGVFLALYFTAVSTVAASVYVNVPHDIRALIVRDRLGGIYVAGTAFTTALSVTLLIAHTLTSATYELAPLVVGLLAAFSIFSFIKLGQRAFYLADPTRLGGSIVVEFLSWFKRATAQGWRWRDPSFQEHYRSRAALAVASLRSLVAIADDQPHLRGSSVRQLCSQVSGMLTLYLTNRNRVPTASRWFGERYEHKQWYLTDSTELDMATATVTQLQPKVVPNVPWVEDELLPALTDVVVSAVTNGDLGEAFQVLSGLESVYTALGRSWDVQYADRRIADLTTRILGRLLERADLDDLGRTPGAVAVFDALAMLPLDVELGFHRYVMESPGPHARIPDVASLAKSGAPYENDLPRAAIGTIEQMQAARTFERAVRSMPSTQTPDWYVSEMVSNTYETRFKEQVDGVLDLLTSWYPQTATRLKEAHLAGPLGAVIERGLEICWKLERHIADWQQIATSVRPVPVRVDVVRPEWDWESTQQRVVALRRDLLQRLTSIVSMQGFDHRDPSLPDYLGGAVHWMGESCMEALLANDKQLFSDLFPTYFVGLLFVTNSIQEQTKSWQPTLAITALAEPLIDLMELSGYAYVFSELHGNPKLWEVCKERWDKYLGDASGPDYLKRVAGMHAYHRNQFALTHRATTRTRWEMAANHVLSEVPRAQSTSWYDDGEVEHPSPMIRRIAPRRDDLGSPFHASDIFAVVYLVPRPDASGLDFGVADWVARDLIDNEDEEASGDGDDAEEPPS
jgi:hypothetical protein